MPDRNPPPFRYWGNKQPSSELHVPIRAEITPKADGNVATIRLYDPIDSWGGFWGVSAKEFATALDALGSDVDTIELHVNSPGGDAYEGIAILNVLRQHKAAVNVTIDGIAASAASLVAMAGDTVTMARNSQMMIHDASGIVIGNAKDMADFAAVLDKLSGNYASAYADRAGGTADDWREAMQAETWYTAEEAVEAKLADKVLPKTKSDDGDATARFDLSIFAHAGREHAPAPLMPAARATKTPAEPPVVPSNKTEEADTMSDTLIQGLRERFSLADDADEATVLAKADELLDSATTPPKPVDPPVITDDAIATARNLTAEQVKAALEQATKPAAKPSEPVVPDGKVVISQNVLDELRAGAAAGAEARKKQLEEDRDKTIAQAFSDGKISADRRDAWKTAWDKDPEGAKADLDSLPVRFPVAAMAGYAGGESKDADEALFNTFFPATQTQEA